MQEKKSQQKSKGLPELSTSVTEILVVNGRAFQPFIRTFSYTGENITKAGLGTLLGVFEIDDQSEDSAYIVNFLASVAKKEYFNNPRRGAIESFEAALHKINLALAELVKHGNITWLGKFHGALGILEKNNFHFSVTGKARILLSRNDTIADIGAGLASEESHIHPIKTFVEVSSGRLSMDDQLLLSSPELLALFSLEELSKNAARMDTERFTQFLKTALVNELDMAGLMMVDVLEKSSADTAIRQAETPREKAPVQLQNVFSQSTFAQKKKTEEPLEQTPSELPAKEEYVDSKTGHIYVQGDVPETPGRHQFLLEFWAGFVEISRSFFAAQGRYLRKAKKQISIAGNVLGEESRALGRKANRALKRQWRKRETKKESAVEEKLSPEIPLIETPAISVTDIPLPKKETASIQLKPAVPTHAAVLSEEAELSEQPGREEAMPQFLKEKLAAFYQKKQPLVQSPLSPEPTPSFGERFPVTRQIRPFFDRLFRRTAQFLRTIMSRLRSLELRGRLGRLGESSTKAIRVLAKRSGSNSSSLTPQRKQLLYGTLGLATLLFVGMIGWLIFTKEPSAEPNEQVEVTGSDAPNPLSPAPIEKNNSIELSEALRNTGDIVTSVILNDQAYAISKSAIITISGNNSYTLPDGARAKYATAMDDLRLLFIYTDTGTLYAWSPISKTFVKNNLALASGANVIGIDTYLTYLYVLDSESDQVYRFPRAEGGFGAGSTWLKDAVTIEAGARLSVNETLYIALDQSTIKGYFGGRMKSTFELPEGLRITDLYTHPGLANVYALDSEHHRIIIWNQDGRIVREITHDRLATGQTLSVNEKTGELFVSTADSVLSLKVK